VAGMALAYVAYLIFLRNYRGENIGQFDRRVAPLLALSTFAFVAFAGLCFWFAFVLSSK